MVTVNLISGGTCRLDLSQIKAVSRSGKGAKITYLHEGREKVIGVYEAYTRIKMWMEEADEQLHQTNTGRP